ncbi:MAG: hypothetical protein CM1200mP15_12990 [Dehalococcoidia bacterium]|nr:MAG: hypothetical protein CM1200mP15_12990 [Dehalococcoidia bacterium]
MDKSIALAGARSAPSVISLLRCFILRLLVLSLLMLAKISPPSIDADIVYVVQITGHYSPDPLVLQE